MPITKKQIIYFTIVFFAIFVGRSFASGSSTPTADTLPQVLLGLIIILIAAKLGGDLLMRFGQPAVLGEMIFGIVVGNIYLLGFHGLDFIRTDENIRLLSEIGVIILLLQVGLESDINKLLQVGGSSLVVATLGVIAPFSLGWVASSLLLPAENTYIHVFIGATLCATSVGITARVLQDIGKLQTREARIILGAAIIDDVQGLIILATVLGIINSAARGTSLSVIDISIIVIKAIVFLVLAIVIGRWLSPRVFKFASRLKGNDLLVTVSLGICFALAYLSKLVGLAPIVGAFSAGLILEDVHWRSYWEPGERSIQALVAPIAALLVPIFFVRMGSEIDLTTFANLGVLVFAGSLTVAAVIGKQICGLGVIQKGIDRLSVGIGMIPRGEVGLIFAAMGSSTLINGHKIIQPNVFSAIVLMVIITTLVTPPLLKWSMTRKR